MQPLQKGGRGGVAFPCPRPAQASALAVGKDGGAPSPRLETRALQQSAVGAWGKGRREGSRRSRAIWADLPKAGAVAGGAGGGEREGGGGDPRAGAPVPRAYRGCGALAPSRRCPARRDPQPGWGETQAGGIASSAQPRRPAIPSAPKRGGGGGGRDVAPRGGSLSRRGGAESVRAPQSPPAERE